MIENATNELTQLCEWVEKLGNQDQGIRYRSAVRRSRKAATTRPPPLAELALFGERAEIVMALIENSRSFADALRAALSAKEP